MPCGRARADVQPLPALTVERPRESGIVMLAAEVQPLGWAPDLAVS